MKKHWQLIRNAKKTPNTTSTSKWRLNPLEVDMGWKGKSHCINLTHRPTGIVVSGELPKGKSRREQRVLIQQKEKELFEELERKVAKHLLG
jgi:hypothetical protein